MRVTLYGREGCRATADLRRWLEGREMPYAFRDVASDPAGLEEVRRLGAPVLPVVVVERPSGREVVLGCDLRRLERVWAAR
jgi:glutaredoxin